MSVIMSRCPHCNAPLLGSLAAAVADPAQPESCPRFTELPPSTSAGEQSATSSSVVAPGRSTAGVPSTQETNGRLPVPTRPGHPPGT